MKKNHNFHNSTCDAVTNYLFYDKQQKTYKNIILFNQINGFLIERVLKS